MLRKFVCAAIIVVFGLSVAMAEEITALISKVDGGKVTFKKFAGQGKKGMAEGDDITLPVKADAKITKGAFNMDTKKLDAGEAIADGLKSDTFTKIDAAKGLRATITTDADNKNITSIVVGGGGGGGKGAGGKGGKKAAGAE